ncbi:hypothetical protein C8245_23080 [Paracidovorax avenae]|uniref:hypothetical protein n=1 Tax=Paracidovorax avenae TaxID=80867 RepID=UPI000D20F3BA|nr:hypothetical protein [Paracidovorax avenae]AVS68161.1 hypothetical protein C8245_23080 [Paracidovorax avenae]
MAFLFRCPECRTRRRDYGLFTQHLRDSGHKLCDCGGYHYRHRPDSPYCHRNPYSVALEASRFGTSDAEVEAIALEIQRSIASTLPSRRRRPTDPLPPSTDESNP